MQDAIATSRSHATPSKNGGAQILDLVMQQLDLPNDSALARALKADGATISRIRRGTGVFSATLIVRIHLATNVQIKDLYAMLGTSID